MVQFCLDFRYLIYRLKSVSIIIFLSVFFPLYQITSLALKMESYLQKKVPCRHSSKIRCVGLIYMQYCKIFGQNFAIPVIVQRLVGWRWCQPPAVAFTAKKGRQGCKFCKLCRGRPILKRRRKKIPKKFGNSSQNHMTASIAMCPCRHFYVIHTM